MTDTQERLRMQLHRSKEEVYDNAAWLCVYALKAANMVPYKEDQSLFEKIRSALIGNLSL